MATMSCFIFSLLGFFYQLHFNPSVVASSNATTPAPTTTPPNPCVSYKEINDAWRNFAFTSTTYKGFPNTDKKLKDDWIRFIGIGGDRIVDKCPQLNVGGTNYGIYVPFEYPHVNQTTTSGLAYLRVSGCHSFSFTMEIMYCPGDFFLYKVTKADNYGVTTGSFLTYHYSCTAESCGPNSECVAEGGCDCIAGHELLPGVVPTPETYGCTDIDECINALTLCGVNSECENVPSTYICSCTVGYQPTNTSLPSSSSNLCIDVDECEEPVCDPYGDCQNSIGSYTCLCNIGFVLSNKGKPECIDIDECLEEGLCGPNAICTNTIGSYFCECEIGYVPTDESGSPNRTNICIDMDECERFSILVDKFKNIWQTVCGPNSNCTNTIGSYFCTCNHGYRITSDLQIASVHNPCIDIDECVEQPGICGIGALCTNVPGTFICSCPEKYYPNTGLEWIVGTTYCKYVQKTLSELPVIQGKTKEGVFFEGVNHQLDNLTFVPVPTLANGIAACMEVAGVGPLAEDSTVSSSGDGAVGTDLLDLSDRLVGRMVNIGYNHSTLNVKNSAVDLSIETYGYSGGNLKGPPLLANGNSMEINMDDLAKNNNGSAVAGFVTLIGMESLLSHQYLKTENRTEMLSDVITAVLPMMNHTNITDPVNFTILHKKPMLEDSMVTCVYWKVEKDDVGLVTFTGWSTEGCTMTFSNENYTVCSCTHLSTFALIMQIAEPPPQNDFLDWLERICVIVGLFFFALCILTFLLCSWNPKINNTARLHLCLNLGLSHLLLLWVDRYVDDRLACKVLAGLLHFLIVASFVWMQLEAVQLFMLVRKLTKVQVIKRDGLPKPVLYFVGYGVPMVIVGVSAVIYSDGYGAVANTCWLSNNRSFNWALTGPVIAILALNCMLFGATLWSLRTTIANMRSGASDSKETRLVLFKIVAQFVILGCTWILGLYQTNLFFRVLFIILNSQQGTFLYVVHCVLNKEIRDEYIKWLSCACKKQKDDDDDKDLPSVSEDLDKTK